MKRTGHFMVVFAAAGLMLAGCEDDAPPAKAPPSNAKKGLGVLTKGSAADPAAPAADTPPPPPPPAAAVGEGGEEDVSEIAYAYSPIGKRDPFRSLFDQLQREEQTQQLTELQKFELDQLKLVAIVSRIATPYAMVEDPDSKGHTLTRGTLIGKNWGRVAQINPDCVVIREEYRDYTGRKVTNKSSMCLPKPDELKID
ncbi:MAG: pilus assembly protein PilP [Deltaproteobacteria bacterium]